MNKKAAAPTVEPPTPWPCGLAIGDSVEPSCYTSCCMFYAIVNDGDVVCKPILGCEPRINTFMYYSVDVIGLFSIILVP
eukprot:1033982-Rhodomonas_salina.1